MYRIFSNGLLQDCNPHIPQTILFCNLLREVQEQSMTTSFVCRLLVLEDQILFVKNLRIFVFVNKVLL
jgi:hypothetical protein